MSVDLWAILSVALVSGLSALGYFILGRQRGAQASRGLIFFLVSLAVGVLFGDVFFHLVPELFSEPATRNLAPWFILAGFLAFFVLEKFLRWRHCHLPEESHYHPVVSMTLMGDAAHNFMDGLIIGAAYALNFKIGLATSLAVFCHELPAELGRYGVLLKGGMSPNKALLFNALSAVTSFLGLFAALAAIQISPSVSSCISAATAGGFVYIAGSDLVPELHHELSARRSALQFIAILLGLASMAALKTWLG